MPALSFATSTKQDSYTLPTNNLLLFRMPADGTITRLAVYAADGPVGDDAEFDLKKNGVTALGGPLLLLDGANAAETTIAVAAVKDDLIRVDLLSTPTEIGDDLTVYVDFLPTGGGNSGVKVDAPTTNPTIANSNAAYITWDNGEIRDDGGWFDVGGDEAVITAPVAGWVDIKVGFTLAVSGGSGGPVEVDIEQNGNVIGRWKGANSSSVQVHNTVVATAYLAVNDEIRILVNNLSGSSLTTNFVSGPDYFSVVSTGKA